MGYKVSPVKVVTLLVFVCACCLAAAAAFSQEPVKVVEVAITGNENINTDAIRNAITLKEGDDYTEAAVEKDRAAIMSMGYFSVVTVHRDEVQGGIKVTYEVTENAKVSDIKIVGSDPIPAETIRGLMRTKPGQVLNTGTVNQDIEEIQTYYADKGYVAYVTEDIAIDPETGVLTVPILVHRVESVEIVGNKKTRTYVFLREMKTQPGEVFNVNVLKEDIMRIYNLDILEDIKSYDVQPGSSLGLVRITLPVVEKKTGQVSLGFGYSSKQRLVGQARLSESNYRGKGQGINLLWEQGTSDAVGGSSSYEIGVYEPWLDSKHTSLSATYFNKVQYRFSSGLFGSSTFEDDTNYNERRKGGDLTLSRPLTEKTRIYLGGRFENVDTDPSLLDPTSDLANIVQTGDVTTGSLRLVHNTRDFDLDPAAGGYEGISVEIGRVDAVRYESGTLNPIPFEGTFHKGSIDIRRYFSKGGPKTTPQDKRNTIAVRLRLGMAGGEIPFFEQFFVGGSESLRGYREDRFWGTKMLVATVEYRKPIAQSIGGVLFVDYGDAWDTSPDFNITEFTQHQDFRGNLGYGVGMRITTPIGHIRLDYGIGSEGSRTHFSMGHSF